MNANINCHFSQKGLGENFYFLGFLLTHIGYWAGVIVIPQVHFKSHLSTFQARCAEGKEVKTQYLLCSCKNGILQKKRSSLENGLFQKQILLVVDSFMFVEDFSTNSSISISEGLSKS